MAHVFLNPVDMLRILKEDSLINRVMRRQVNLFLASFCIEKVPEKAQEITLHDKGEATN